MGDEVESSAGVRPGDVLAGKYRIEQVLGVGGMGVVVAATHLQLDTKVALKFLLPAMLRNKDVVNRFAREARAAVRIQSEHVARVLDVGTLESGAPYMVMEFLEGEDLAAWLMRQGPLPVELTVDFVLQACVAVANAHSLGIVHRDLKPANLFCLRGSDRQFLIKVLDFGISKITNLSASDSGGSMTHTTAVMGSPYYMSPEQMQSAKEVDARTDIWALGVILYELLCGSTPFVGESFAEIAIKVATTPFAPVRSLRTDVPPGLEAVIFRCLEKKKTERFGNVADLAVALGEFAPARSRPSIDKIVGILQTGPLAGGPSGGRSSARGSSPDAPESLGTMAPSANTAPGSQGARGGRRAARTLSALGIGGAVSVAAIVAAVLIMKRPREPAPLPMAASAVSAGMGPVAASASAEVRPVESAPAVPVLSAAVPVVPVVPAAPVAVSPIAAPSRVAPKGVHKAAEGGPPAGPGTSMSNCRVVSFFDADGNQHFKQQCGN